MVTATSKGGKKSSDKGFVMQAGRGKGSRVLMTFPREERGKGRVKNIRT